MIKISTKGRYVLRLMIQLASDYGNGAILLKDIAEEQDVSANYLAQLISPLKSAGLIVSNRGSHGGYMLSRKPTEINVRQIIEAVEGPISLVECVHAPEICSRVERCLSRKVWIQASEQLAETFASTKLSEKKKKKRKA